MHLLHTCTYGEYISGYTLRFIVGVLGCVHTHGYMVPFPDTHARHIGVNPKLKFNKYYTSCIGFILKKKYGIKNTPEVYPQAISNLPHMYV